MNKQTMQPIVSIGMPVYNGEKYIREALDSLLAQTFTDFELIISDNASNDNTQEICEEYVRQHPRIRYIRQENNNGALVNFQVVLNEAKGAFFMWAAADDIWHPQFIQTCQDFLIANNSVAVVLPNYQVLSSGLPFLKITKFPDMSFLSNDDAFVRVSNYVMLNCLTHKANLVYGLWRRACVLEVNDKIRSFGSELLSSAPIDVVFLIVTLALFKAAQIQVVLFYKMYTFIPPGHWLGRIVNPIIIIINYLLGKRTSLFDDEIGLINNHLSLINLAMDIAEFPKNVTEELLERKSNSMKNGWYLQ